MPIATTPTPPLVDTKQMKVTGFAEVEVEPDECCVQIQISSVKTNVQMAEISAKKRLEYARQEIQNFGCQIIASYHHVHQENEAYYCTWNLKVKDQIERIDQLINHLKYKLSGYLEMSPPTYLISCDKMKEMRGLAIKQAVLDARQKSQTIASVFGQNLSHLISVNEAESIEDCDPNLVVKSQSGEWNAYRQTSQSKRISTKVEVICSME